MMPYDQALHIGIYLQLGIFVLFLGLFLVSQFYIRPAELNQFSFQKRMHLTIASIMGEENFFSKPSYKKLKVYRKVWIVLLLLLVALICISIWLVINKP